MVVFCGSSCFSFFFSPLPIDLGCACLKLADLGGDKLWLTVCEYDDMFELYSPSGVCARVYFCVCLGCQYWGFVMRLG